MRNERRLYVLSCSEQCEYINTIIDKHFGYPNEYTQTAGKVEQNPETGEWYICLIPAHYEYLEQYCREWKASTIDINIDKTAEELTYFERAHCMPSTEDILVLSERVISMIQWCIENNRWEV